MGELQRTYRGRARREERPERPFVTAKREERAVVIASMAARPEEEQDRLTEMRELLRTAGAGVVWELVQHRAAPDPRTFLGKGRLEELVEWMDDRKIDVVVAEGDLTAPQHPPPADRLNPPGAARSGP